MGLLDKADATLRESVESASKYGVNSPNYRMLLACALGRVYYARQAYPDAEKMLLLARDLSVQLYGPDHMTTAIMLGHLGVLYRGMRRDTDAESTYRQALSILQAKVSPDHPVVANLHVGLGNTLYQAGKIAESRDHFERALAIDRHRLDATHPDLIAILTHLASIAARQERWQDAVELTSEARRNTRRSIGEVLPALAPDEQLQFLFHQDRWALTSALSLSIARLKVPDMQARAVEWLLNSKGVAQQALAERTVEARTATDPRAAQVIEQLQTVRRQLVRLRGKAAEAEQVLQQLVTQIQDLIASESKLTAEFAKLSGVAYRQDPWIDLAEVRAKLGADAVMVELAKTQVFSVDGSDVVRPPEHYLAWIVPPAGEVQLVDLGLAETIDAAVLEARMAIEQAPTLIEKSGRAAAERAAQEPLGKLSRLVLAPLVPHLGSAKRIELSPDGDLWLVPWAALPLEDGRYAVEKYDIRYQISGRELVSVADPLPLGPPMVFADPDYFLSPAEVAAATQSVLRSAQRRSAAIDGSSANRGRFNVPRLPGTAREAEAITPSLEQLTHNKPQVYTDRWALEGVFKAVRRPRVLVASTHGFFMPDQETKTETGAGIGDRSAVPVTRAGQPLENPLARCGLLMAGCNTPAANGQQDDGILTGLDIVGTDLRGTELVVLSACQTALGDLHRGEGVAGLRQAFQLAGAQAVIATLWQIDDSETAAFMSDLFGNLAAGQSKSDALRAAQLKMIEAHRAQDGSTHPYYWAPFTLTGI
jgi:CHAT domain-containing protein